MSKITLTVTEEQLCLVNKALEEYFRLRLNQWRDFADDVCAEGVDFSLGHPNHDDIFNDYIRRRNALQRYFKHFFKEFTISTHMKSQDRIDMIDMWEAIRHWLWQQKPADKRKEWTVDARTPLHEGQYPLPMIKKVKD